MARKPINKQNFQFPIGEKTIAAYRRNVKNTQAKIRRTKKKHGIDLSNEVKIPLLEEFTSRKDFNQWVKEQEKFRSRNNLDYQFVTNEYGVTASKAIIQEIELNTRKAQRMADREIKKYEETPFYQGGTQYGTLGMQPGRQSGIYRPNNFDFSKIRQQNQLEYKRQAMITRSQPDYYDERMERMKTNFIKTLIGSFNDDAARLIAEIENIPAEDFYEIYKMFDIFDFDLYPSDGTGIDIQNENSLGSIESMLDIIQKYKNNELDFDFKNENFN